MTFNDARRHAGKSTLPTIPNSDAYNWIIGPVTRCIQAVSQGANLSGILQRAVTALAEQEAMLLRFEALLRQMGAGDRLEKLEALSKPSWSDYAKDLIKNDLHEVHVPGIIALWASLEVAVEDTVTLILVYDPKAVVDVADAGVKLPARCPTPVDEVNARRIFSRFEQLSRETRNIAQAYAHVLQTLDVRTVVEPEIFEVLAELNYVRNCILHRGGIVDSRVSFEAPNSGLKVGDVVHITLQDYLRYYRAVGTFARSILDGTLTSRHLRLKVSVASLNEGGHLG